MGVIDDSDLPSTPHLSSASTTRPSSSSPPPAFQEKQQKQQEMFMHWCRDSLGISAELVEIDFFPYNDYLQAMEERVDIFCEDCNDGGDSFGVATTDDYLCDQDEDALLSVTDYPMISVRGLKAAQNIEVGQLLIQIPHSSLWTLANIIDADPVLSPSLGLQARKDHRWDSQVDEIPLLAVALLYHMQLGLASPHWPYLQQLLFLGQHGGRDEDDGGKFVGDSMQELQRSIPHLWSSKKLRHAATPAVRAVAKGIRQDVMELYETIVMVLVEDFPLLFGDPNPIDSLVDHDHHHPGHDNDDDEYNETTDDHDDQFLHRIERRPDKDRPDAMVDQEKKETAKEWMFSLERFHWAFALVNSRHWHLPIPANPLRSHSRNRTGKKGVDDPTIEAAAADAPSSDDALMDDHVSFSDQEGPPASTPTDEWLDFQRELQQKEEEAELQKKGSKQQETSDGNGIDLDREVPDQYDLWPSGDSFLAPLADLLNFGPPCTRGMYNETTDSFDIVATCPFTKGQEITFWYTDACEDVFVANYGFTTPMLVPKCPHPATERIQQLEEALQGAWQDLDMLDSEVDRLLEVIHDCHCENQTNIVGSGGPGTGSIPPKAPNPPKAPQDRQRPPAQQQQRRRDGPRWTRGANQREGNRKNSNHAEHAIRGGNRRAGAGSGGSAKRSRTPQSSKDMLARDGSGMGRQKQGQSRQSRKSEF